MYGEELEVNGAAVAVVVADVRDAWADGGVDAEFFVEFAGEGLFWTFAGLYFAAGKFPLEGHWLVGASLADEDAAAAEHECCYDQAQCSGALGNNGCRVLGSIRADRLIGFLLTMLVGHTDSVSASHERRKIFVMTYFDAAVVKVGYSPATAAWTPSAAAGRK